VGSRSVIATYRASPSPVLADGCGVARQGDLEQLELFAGDKRAQADVMLRRIEAGGPLAASDVAISMAPKRHVVWSEAKHALEWLFWAGLVAATLRRVSFERVYDLLERVLPRAMLNAPTPRSHGQVGGAGHRNDGGSARLFSHPGSRGAASGGATD
jgi:hypothetical protein